MYGGHLVEKNEHSVGNNDNIEERFERLLQRRSNYTISRTSNSTMISHAQTMPEVKEAETHFIKLCHLSHKTK